MSVSNTYQVKVDIKKKPTTKAPEVIANDKVVFEVEVFDNGTLFPLDQSYIYYLVSKSYKKDANAVIRQGTLTNGKIVFALGSSEFEHIGKVEATVQIFDSTNKRVSTAYFDYKVVKDNSFDGELPNDEKNLVIVNESVLNDITEQLADTAKKTDVFTLANMGPDVRVAMTGGSVAVVGINSIFESNIVDEQISPEKIKNITFGKNMLDKSRVKGTLIGHASGTESANELYFSTDYFIKVTPGESIRSRFSTRFIYYDMNKQFVSGFEPTGGVTAGGIGVTVTIPANVYYMKVCFRRQDLNSNQIERGTVTTTYAPFNYCPSGLVAIDKERVSENSVNISYDTNGKVTQVTGSPFSATLTYNESGVVTEVQVIDNDASLIKKIMLIYDGETLTGVNEQIIGGV